MSILARLRSTLRTVFRRNQAATEVSDELQFHLDSYAADLVEQGIPEGEARRLARVALGSPLRNYGEIHRRAVGLQLLDETLSDVRYGIRGLWRNPLFAITLIATLTLGIGATTAIFSVVDRVLFRPLPYPQSERLISLGLTQPLEPQEFAFGAFFYDWSDRQQPFLAMTAESAVTSSCDLTENNPIHLSCPAVLRSFLPTFGIQPVLGRNFSVEEDRPHGPRVALISYGLWQDRFGFDRGVLDRTLQIDGNSVRIIGVLPAGFKMPRLQPVDVLFPLVLDEAAMRQAGAKGDTGVALSAFGRLKPGISLKEAQRQMGPLFSDTQKIIPPEIRKDFHLCVRSLRDRQMQDIRLTAWVLFGCSLSVLLIACANAAGLLLARGASRQRELALRSALGASRFRLVRQAFTEAALISIVSVCAACLACFVLLRLLVASFRIDQPLIADAHLNVRVISYAISIALLCTLFFGTLPAVERPRSIALSGRLLKTNSRAVLRQLMVSGQIAFTLVLLALAMLFVRSFKNLQHQRLGIDSGQIVTATITLGHKSFPSPQSQMAFFERLEQRVRFGPGVTMVSVSDSLPPSPNHTATRFFSLGLPGRRPLEEVPGDIVAYRWVSPGYLKTLGIPILAGHDFTSEERSSSESVLILSHRLASRLYPKQNPIGERIQVDRPDPKGRWYTVVGVADNVKNGGLAGKDEPEYYRLRRDRPEDWDSAGAWSRTSVVAMRSIAAPSIFVPWLRTQVAALDPTLPVEIETLQSSIEALAGQPRLQTMLVSLFAAIGLILAAIGLYGVLAYLVTERTQEIGIRMALGASRNQVLRLVFKRSLRLIVWGSSIGLILAFGASHVLAILLFGVSPDDLATFVAMPVLLIGVSLLATFIPARSAARVDPMVALRSE